MAISLTKGGNVSLSGTDPGLKNILVGLGWDARATAGDDFDLDASAFMLGAGGNVITESGFVYFGNLQSPDGAVVHAGDNRTGEGDGDDEELRVALDRVPAEVQTIVITVTIYDADRLRQNFGQVRNAYIRVVNDESGREIARYDLAEDYSTETALVFGEIYRRGAEWKFRAVGQGYAGGLRALCGQYGVQVA